MSEFTYCTMLYNLHAWIGSMIELMCSCFDCVYMLDTLVYLGVCRWWWYVIYISCLLNVS